jgi:predicted  nucleic acid-binding Zn-ribbon protein
VNEQLTTLLELQDLRSKLREMQGEDSALQEVESEHFGVEPADFIAQLEEKIAALEDQLDVQTGRRYQQAAKRLDRVVVPVINGVCYGCFVSIATAKVGEENPNAELRRCENCGRFIYILN